MTVSRLLRFRQSRHLGRGISPGDQEPVRMISVRGWAAPLLFFALLTQNVLADPPRRAMVLVFDQMRAEYVDRYDMTNFKRARALGIHFENGIVGHLESNTIVSHPVISTGKLPKNLPWGTHVMKDVKGLIGEKNSFYTPFQLTPEQWMDLHRRTSGDTSLLARVKKVNPGPTFAVAQKKYAALNYGGPFADTIICLDSAIKSGEMKGHHQPGGRNVPDYISKPVGNRFYVGATNDWGSHDEVYPFHGNSFVTGNDPKRPGGDIWVGDVVEQIMTREKDWSVILASFGTIDKVSHVLAEHDRPTTQPWAHKNKISLKDATRKADLELGRILDRLEASGLDQETVLVITADHGGQHNRFFHGNLTAGAHQDNLFYGLGHTDKVPKAVHPLVETGLLEVTSMNTILLCWTRPTTANQSQDFVSKLSQTAGVCEVYQKVRRYGEYRYHLKFRSDKLQGKEREWAVEHNPDLVATLASETGPQYIGLLFDRHGYDVPGSHGGAQELVQRIPYIVVAPNLKKRGITAPDWVRLVDVNAIVGEVMGLEPHPRLDGSSEAVRGHLRD